MRTANVFVVAAVAVGIGIGIGAAGVIAPVQAGGPQTDKPRPFAPEQQERMNLMKSKGSEASLTILPIRLAGNTFDRLAEVVGLLLEQQGLKNIELGKTAFKPEDKIDTDRLAFSLGEFLRRNPITTDYALYTEFNGTRETGLVELRAIVVDKAGAIVWADRQSPENERFKRLKPPEPMTVSMLLVERLSPQLSLSEETRKAAKPGKMARLMDERSGMPPENERTPLPRRQAQMKAAMPNATLVVFPARVRMAGSAADAATSTDLVKMINDAGLCKAEPANQSLLLKASQADPNELKVLWDLAREFRDYARKNPTNADYLLYADYTFSPQRWEQGSVHFIVCNREGEWVIVDMQNSHHGDYQSIKPNSRGGCDKLLLKRLEGYLR